MVKKHCQLRGKFLARGTDDDTHLMANFQDSEGDGGDNWITGAIKRAELQSNRHENDGHRHIETLKKIAT